jgi:hypothetical protein
MMQIVEDQNITSKLVQKLRTYISEFEKSGTPFEKIFNNDKIKYDCYDNNFFCFKEHGANRCTYRLLYRFVRKGATFDIEPHVTVLKRYSAKNGNKDYIKYFTKYAKEFVQA